MTRYRVALRKEAREDLDTVKDTRTKRLLIERMLKLESEPEKQGKPLIGDLRGFYSVRAVGQRYRVIYELQEVKDLVVVVVIGIRKEGDKRDVYRVARRRLMEDAA